MNPNDYLEKTKVGFKNLSVDEIFKKCALLNLKNWIINKDFKDYLPQIKHLIDNEDWDYLLDCFYQTIPFGTGGRRGEVGIGPNRINKWTIQASAQGHSQYLTGIHKKDVQKRGVVLAYGVRKFYNNKHFNQKLENPVKYLTGKSLAYSAAEVYLANGIKIYIFDAPRTTPELSFAIRYLKAIAGCMFDASHNPPDHNGKKVFDEFGGQLIPPHDEILVTEVTKKVEKIKTEKLSKFKNSDLFLTIGKKVDNAFINEVCKLSLSKERDIKIIFTPLHGVGCTTVIPVLKKLKFNILPDPLTSYQSGKFENITFNIPNPEVVESFDTTLKFAQRQNADIILNSDPDADRIGIMVDNKGVWEYLNGNEIGAILTRFVIEKKKPTLKGKGIVIKTSVTTNLATKICIANDIKMIGELPVGFKYIGEIMNNLEKEGKIENFLLGLEESNGYIAGNYLRDKDSAVAALWLSELAAELKKENKTLIDYLNDTYSNYGYFRNYLTEIRLPGAEGMSKIRNIQNSLRKLKPAKFGRFVVERFEDFLDRKPIVSETDKQSKDVLVFHFKPENNISTMKITIRGSGTEPKIKMYFEIGNNPTPLEELESVKENTENILSDLEKSFMKYCYKLIGVDFPDRGFLLFWQLPLNDKLNYFEIEGDIENLIKIKDTKKRKEKLYKLLEFLGSDPVEKINKAFTYKHNISLFDYLSLNEPIK